ncbi:TPA: hypothetical protein N0F65_005873 [Lagenidium giganteum]|uniref:Uncharacterized protein n=1 Tax=Lagenidium giganteum TaxID=4803 RepID=A0AAV2YKP1_9STRA|nr:TPA: hypothetical protein N0F65_005873 [Lagenidium giganteum]
MRFTPEQGQELMRELLKHRPFAPQYGQTMKTWDCTATSVSAALGVTINAKPVRDRLKVLREIAGARRASFASGGEESLDAGNELDHYREVSELVSKYVQLETAHKDVKRRRIL